MSRFPARATLIAATTGALVFALASSAAAQSHVPLRIESAGPPMEVELTGSDGAYVVCETPCALAAEPGTFELEAHARGVRGTRATLDVGEAGARWQIHTGGSAAFAWGVVLTVVGAAALGLVGVIVALPLASASDDPYNQMMATIGGTVGGIIGLTALIGGIALVTSNQNGVELGLVPTAGGAMAMARLRL